MQYSKVLELAFQAQENAYAPYSNFKIGACALMSDGTYFLGANIENCAYGSTMCGERVAIFSAYANGYRKEDFVALAIVSSCEPAATPCGSCRQVISELLCEDTPIILANSMSNFVVTNAKELLPSAFTKERL